LEIIPADSPRARPGMASRIGAASATAVVGAFDPGNDRDALFRVGYFTAGD
jgi:hypothetical protein